MTEWPPDLGARTVIFHTTNTRRLREAGAREIVVASFGRQLALRRRARERSQQKWVPVLRPAAHTVLKLAGNPGG